ncbi:MAG: hypothetical protein PVJ01_06400, partial [Pseudomonadota bacterium]
MAFGRIKEVFAALIKSLPALSRRVLMCPFAHKSTAVVNKKRRAGDQNVSCPALCAPGPSLSRAGSRLTQAVVFVLILAMSGLVTGSALAVPAGTVISNAARSDYTLGGNPQTAFSNSLDITTVIIGTQSVLETFRYSPSSPSLFLTVGITPYFDGGGFTPAPAPVDPATGTNINLGTPLPLEPSSDFSQDDPVFILLTDPDANGDPAVAETAVITIENASSGTIETLLLTETGADTGAFTGYIRSGAPTEVTNDGILFGYPGAQFSGEYTDPTDPADSSSALFLFDAAGVLWVTAVPGKNTVSPGDYLTYTLTVQNNSGYVTPGTVFTTDLPVGFRYENGSTKVDGISSPDPIAAPDGRSLAFSVGDLAPGQTVTITIVARVGAGARPGRAIAPNVAASGLVLSNTAMAAVRVTEEFSRSRNAIMGRVLTGACGANEAVGLGDIRIFLEDGTYVLTDEKGRYHFEGVRSGTHVVQLDLETVPEMYEVVMCDNDTRQAGRPWSRFVDLKGGALWRVDFNLAPKAPEEGRAVLVLKTNAEPGRVVFNATMKGEQVPLKNVRFRVALPDGVMYETGTAMLEGKAIGDPEITGNTLVWNIGDVSGAWVKGITFETVMADGWEWFHEGDMDDLDPERTGDSAKLVQGEMNEVVSSASVVFDSPVQKNMTTPEARNVLLKVAEREETRTKK